jgi:hypothetical protein
MENVQSTSCDLYGDEGQNYLECLLTQPDEGIVPVNLVNNKTLFMSNLLYEHSIMSNSLYEPHPKDSPKFQKWVQVRSNSRNYGNCNQNSYQNN